MFLRVSAALRFGPYEVRRVVEWVGPIAPVSQVLPDTPASYWAENRDWLVPSHLDGKSYRAAIQTWVIEGAGETILVDTGVGNDRIKGAITSNASGRKYKSVCHPNGWIFSAMRRITSAGVVSLAM